MTTESTVTPVPAPGALRARDRLRLDPRYLAPFLVTLILIAGNLTFGMLESPWKTGLAIVVAIGVEIMLARLLRGVWPHLASGYISGISVGILVRSPFYWPYALCSALTITSKYVVRYRGRHLFNPSNFGIVALLFLVPAAVAPLSVQWDNKLWFMLPIWLVGLAVLYRLRRLHISLTYILSFVFFAAVRVPFTGDSFLIEVTPITGPMYQLFTLFMVTDPATTVRTRRGQIVVVFLVAALECVIRLLHGVHAPFYALFLVGPAALLIEQWRNDREAAKAGPAAALGA